MNDQYQKMEKDKQRELEQQRIQFVNRHESEIQKLGRCKDAEISKLKLEASTRDSMLRRLLGESKHARVKLDIDERKVKLMDELKELRKAKKEMGVCLENANFAERTFSNNLRRHSENFDNEVSRIKKEAQTENRQLIEQLKNKDKLISQLEKDLGRHSRVSPASHPIAVLGRRRSEGSPLLPLSSSTPRALPEGCDDPDPFCWSPTSIQTPADVEDVRTKKIEGSPLGNMFELPIELKESTGQDQRLVDKCRLFLQQNQQLTAQNKAFKESTERASQESKNAQELFEHSKLQLLQMSRQLEDLLEERQHFGSQMDAIENMRQELTEDKKMINALRKACSDKDRRIELLQHRRKRRRVIESTEKIKLHKAGLRETPFGFEDDERQPLTDGNQSMCCSLTTSVTSDDSMWDDMLSKEETERNYQRLMLEQLELQKAHALLQRQSENMQDPQRENVSKAELQNDLFISQCRVEQLELMVKEGNQSKSIEMWDERETMKIRLKKLQAKLKNVDKDRRRLESELSTAMERNEDLEFRLMEIEQCTNDSKEVQCQSVTSQSDSSPFSSSSECLLPSLPPPLIPFILHTAQPTEVNANVEGEITQPKALEELVELGTAMEKLAKELKALLKDKGRDAESALDKLDGFIDKEKAMEKMAHELQVKVIALQQEKNSLQDRLLLMEETKPSGKGSGNSSALMEAKERQENLALKTTAEITSGLCMDKYEGHDDIEDLESCRRIEPLNCSQLSQTKSVEEEMINYFAAPSKQHKKSHFCLSSVSSSNEEGGLEPMAGDIQRQSSGRKSKCRDKSDPTSSKKRKSSFRRSGDNKMKYVDDSSESVESFDSTGKDVISQGGEEQNIPESGWDLDNKSDLDQQLNSMKSYNEDLIQQLHESNAKRLEIESCHQSLQDNIISMETNLDLLHRENVALGEQLRQRVEEFHMTQGERNPRISELEEFCEDLQERLKEAENCERQLREKLKLYEKSIEEAEVQEMAMRERCEQLLTGDYEAKKQIQHLHSTGLELRDIVLEKEIVEQGLRDKVDFLQKAEAASVQRIEELEGMVEELRQQLEEKVNGKDFDQKAAHKLTEMKHKLTFLETDNKALSSRVAELEENEETLRENWRRVAEEDFNRTQCLEEKVKMLEMTNRELKVKLKDAQEYLVVDMSQANLSLAAELAESDAKLFEDSSDDNDTTSGDDLDNIDSPRKHSISSERKALKDSIRTLERQLSEVKEQKNSKIENQQEQLVHLKETEIKLSETISEMEMTERELRAKLALYESSEITVEKMLKYQSKIEELRTSQESLLDQLELKENQEMTLQEQLQEMERTLRGKIVTLEVEMKGYKQRELKSAGYIRELEKQQTDLSTKVAQQAEKENGLYVKISSLMDELKSSNTQLESVKKQMEEKENNIRQAKLLEVKLLEIEMECAKKVSTLDAKLRHREEEFRQKESAFEDQIFTLEELQQENMKLKDNILQKDSLFNEKQEQIQTLNAEILELKKNFENGLMKLSDLEKELENQRTNAQNKEILINELQSEIKSKQESMKFAGIEKEEEYIKEIEMYQNELQAKEDRVIELQGELESSFETIDTLRNEKESLEKETYIMMSSLQATCDKCISEMNEKLSSKLSLLGNSYEGMKSLVCDLQIYVANKSKTISELRSSISEQKDMYENDIYRLENEKEQLRIEIESKVEEEVCKALSEQATLLKTSQEKEASLSFDVSNLQHQVDQHKHEIISKLSELEDKNKINSELSINLSHLRHEYTILEKELENTMQSHTDLKASMKSIVNEKDSQLQELATDNGNLNEAVKQLKVEVGEKNDIIRKITIDKDDALLHYENENKRINEEKSGLEVQLNEKSYEIDRIQQLHNDSLIEVQQAQQVLCERDDVIRRYEQDMEKKEIKLKQTEDHVENSQIEKDNLVQEFHSMKLDLDSTKKQIVEQQNELESLHEQLHDHQTTINELEIIIKEKEEMLQEKDHIYELTSTELKMLSEKLKDRDHKLEQADGRVADVELKLQKAENRVRELESMHVSLEMRLEERYAVTQNAEQLLESKDIQCAEMQTKLDVAEKNLANLKDQINFGDNSYKELAEKLQITERVLEETNIELRSFQSSLESSESENLSLKTELQDLKEYLKSNDENERKIEEMSMAKDKQLKSLEENVVKAKERIDELEFDVLSLNEALKQKDKCCNDYETKMINLEKENIKLQTKYESIHSELEESNKQVKKSDEQIDILKVQITTSNFEFDECKTKLESSSQQLEDLVNKLEKTEQLLNQKEFDFEKNLEYIETLKQTIETMSSDRNQVADKDEVHRQQLENNKVEYQNSLKQLELDNSDLTSVNNILRKESSSLQDIINELQNELDSVKKEKKEALEETVSLKEEMKQVQEDNWQLQREIEEAASEFQMLTAQFEESKGSIEMKLNDISLEKQSIQDKYEQLHQEYDSQTKILTSKEKEVEELLHKCAVLSHKNLTLLSDFEQLQNEVDETKQSNEQKPVTEEMIIVETMSSVSAAPTLNSASPFNHIQVDMNHDSSTVNNEAILELKEKEQHLQKRINELEVVERDLREQIVDIEATVIIPLENENQELKDEISIVKQERDEAVSKIAKWGDDENGSEDVASESEKIHKRLEESLIFGEELEKKNEILLKGIQKLEAENENLVSKVTDLEIKDSEKNDEIENLQQQIEDLNLSQEDTSILEETETTLMDRVLELEERERILIEEVEMVKDSVKNYDEIENMKEKLHYLNKKNQILVDAEGGFIDKIMELEEDKHRLLSKLSSFTDNPNPHISKSHSIHSLPVKNTVSTSTQTSKLSSIFNDDNTGATNVLSCEDFVHNSDSIHRLTSSEQTEKLSVLEKQLLESKSKLEQLDTQLREKEAVVLYLQDKLELLKDSEGKLMDKLLEAEEKASNALHAKYEHQISELHEKLEQFQDENEFLANSVEQYKASFKEEKEKCNILQDKLLDDVNNMTELTKTQEELERTEKMVEEIQSEYEEQISEYMKRITKLQGELSNAEDKIKNLEKSLTERAVVEQLLQEQVAHLKNVEKELVTKTSGLKGEDEDSCMSDSGLSADEPRSRNDQPLDKQHQAVVEPTIHRSIKTIHLSTRPPTTISNTDNSPSNTLNTTSSDSESDKNPVPLPRLKRKLRLASIENIPHEELVLVVEDLQKREEDLKTRIDSQVLQESHLSEKVEKLEFQKCQLEKRLSDVLEKEESEVNSCTSLPGGEDIRNESGYDYDLKTVDSWSVGISSNSNMLEKPEDVLNQRIKELEGLDKHNKNMLSEMERDREVLHEIARKDKITIHDLNVKVRELQLTERSLKEQVASLEVSESSFFTKCEELETIRAQLEDRVHELEIHERRLRELVRKLKLNEEHWLSKSDGMENAVAELSANEAQLKRIVQDMELEKGGMSERVQYLNARIQELENVEITLLERIKAYESNEVLLQNRLVQLENAEAAAHSKAAELDLLNISLAEQHKKMVNENAVMTQHLAQLHGQVQDLDRRLMSSRDSEIAYKQHMESLQKNESLLQKKVREFELREIDSQSMIRELEQTAEINKDKLLALQRSESRLKYRVQELECIPGQIPGELTPGQVEKVPQNIEDCQRRVVVLQNQVENLKTQLRQALTSTQNQPDSKPLEKQEEQSDTINIEREEYNQLHVKASLLDEYAYQNGELEAQHQHLNDTILELRQGKGACGHEVEIEVYKRRIESLQTLINKLKLSLSQGQTTSLLGSELESGPEGETLPARHLQMLESERVLQSVRGLPTNGKADSATQPNVTDHTPVEESIVQATSLQNMCSMPSDLLNEPKPRSPVRLEESHWKAIEAKKSVVSSNTANDLRGEVDGSSFGRLGTNTSSASFPQSNNAFGDMEEVTGFLNLNSESELSSHHRLTHNDTDSCSSPVPPPRKHRANRLSRSNYSSDDRSDSGSESKSNDQHPYNRSGIHKNMASANHKHFDDLNYRDNADKSPPLTATAVEETFTSTQHIKSSTPAPLSRFAEDSFYLPSSTQEGVDSLDDECPPPLPANGPPGQEWATLSESSSNLSSDPAKRENRKESLDNSTSGLSIRERIAMIEKHLQSDMHTGSYSNREEEDQLFYWKKKSTESLRQVESLDRNNKFLKEDINRLEKELEEKRRYINTLEKWLSTTEGLLKNKTKQTDREMVEQLQLDLSKLRRELGQSGYRSEDAMLDAAALKTEVEHKDKEISAKRQEIKTLAEELRRCHKECRNIEGMRRTALDSLRSLEKEVVLLQDADEKLKKAQTEINALKIQYDELEEFKNQAVASVKPLKMKVERLSKKCREKDELLSRLGADLKQGYYPRSSALDELTRLDLTMNGEEYYTDSSDNISEDYSPRVNQAQLRARSASMDELSIHHNNNALNHSFSDTESLRLEDFSRLGPTHSPTKRLRPSPYVNSRPRSAEASTPTLVRSPRRSVPSMQPSKPYDSGILKYRHHGLDLSSEHFIAIADYDPGLFSQSGRPGLELSFREGDNIRVNGPMDRSGYCEAECNGRTGLVPVNYLQPIYIAGMNGHDHNGSKDNHSPQVYHQPKQVASPRHFQSNTNHHQHGFGMSMIPDPPSGVHVRGVENGCLVLAWRPPTMDTKGCNKGLLVKGYVVFVNHQVYQQLPNPNQCEALIQGLDPSTSCHLAVQTLCSRGRVSPRAELVFEGAVRLQADQEADDTLNTDLSSVLNSIHYSKGTKKKVMALHEYNPEHHSPHDYPTYELAFHAGDVISVYGEPRADGFYHGEVEGKRGLVPACFVEDLPARNSKNGSLDAGPESSKA